MAINFAVQVYSHTFDVFARPVTLTPLVSQPGQPAYTARGIYSSQAIDVLMEGNVISDQRTILDIIETEFSVIPRQGDMLLIDSSFDLPAIGSFLIIDVDSNGGGETTLDLRKIVVQKP